MKLSQVIEELVEERGLDKGILGDIVCEGILSAYQKKYPEARLRVAYNKKTDDVDILVTKKIVSTVADELQEISQRKAQGIKKGSVTGEEIEISFEAPIGRIEILRAKQIIAQRIREIEAKVIYDKFKDRAGNIVHGIVHKIEHAGIVVKLDNEALAFLPKSLTIPGERFPAGHTVKAILKEVLVEPRNENQLILDRSSPDFVARLFELEIPEVFEKIVEIKKVVRIPGYKSKVLLISHDKNIDPVGTCIGVGGARIKPILRELGQEKIDVIKAGFSQEDVVRDSLKPAVVNRVELIGGTEAQVYLDDDQRSIAIGKGGQNIALASQLAGIAIHLAKSDLPGAAPSEAEPESAEVENEESDEVS